MLSRSWHFISVVVCLRNSKMCAIFPLPPISLFVSCNCPITWQTWQILVDVVHQPVDMKVDLKKKPTTNNSNINMAKDRWLSVCLSAKIEAASIRRFPFPFFSHQSEQVVFFQRVPVLVSLFNASLNIICELLCHILPRALTVFYD